MTVISTFKNIGSELKSHAPFTLAGAVLGIIFMLFFQSVGHTGGLWLFKIFHPAHVALSAMVTASLYKLRRGTKNVLAIIVIGYVGSVGTATLSDCVIPWFGERVLGLDIPSHEQLDQPAVISESEKNDEAQHHAHGAELHMGFIEEWYLVNPAAVLGLLLAYLWPHTKMPHAAHILISTWASAAHLMMNTLGPYTPPVIAEMLIILFLAVWLPCCASDIVFPMFFVRSSHDHDHGRCWCGREHRP